MPLRDDDRVLATGCGRGRFEWAQPYQPQMAQPVTGHVAHDGPHVGDGRAVVAQPRPACVEAGERLLGDVLRVVGAEQSGQAHHRQMVRREQLGERGRRCCGKVDHNVETLGRPAG